MSAGGPDEGTGIAATSRHAAKTIRYASLPRIGIHNRVLDYILLNTHYRVCRNIKVDNAPTPDHCIHANSTRPYNYRPTRNPNTSLNHNSPVHCLLDQLAPRTCYPEVVSSGQQKNIMAEEDIVIDVYKSARRIY